jgi:hypothetical protein
MIRTSHGHAAGDTPDPLTANSAVTVVARVARQGFAQLAADQEVLLDLELQTPEKKWRDQLRIRIPGPTPATPAAPATPATPAAPSPTALRADASSSTSAASRQRSFSVSGTAGAVTANKPIASTAIELRPAAASTSRNLAMRITAGLLPDSTQPKVASASLSTASRRDSTLLEFIERS